MKIIKNIFFLILIILATTTKSTAQDGNRLQLKDIIQSPDSQFNQLNDSEETDTNENICIGRFNYFASQQNGENKSNVFKSINMPRTPIEDYYSKRVNQNLRLRGYEFFDSPSISSNLSGVVQDNYIIGVGDEIIVYIQGGTSINNDIKRSRVNKKGQLNFDFTSQISALGKSFGDLSNEIKQRVEESLIETEAVVSLGKMKNNTVTVGGEVYCPGIHQVSGLSSIIEALINSGGLRNTGSLRNIKIYQNGNEQKIDLYGLIFGIFPNDLVSKVLSNGSTIIVPALSDTVSISGNVSKPGIYEIKKNISTVASIINLGGGYSSPGGYQLLLYRVDVEGNLQSYKNIKLNTKLKNGDSIVIEKKSSFAEAKFEVVGSVKSQGKFLINQYPYLSNYILSQELLNNNLYRYAAIIKSINNDGIGFKYNTFNLKKLLQGEIDYKIQENDKIFIFSNYDIEFLSSPAVISTIYPYNKISSTDNVNSTIKQTSFFTNQALLTEKDVSITKDLFPFESPDKINSSCEKALKPFKNIKLKKQLLDNIPQIESIISEEIVSQSCQPSIYSYEPEIAKVVLENSIIIRGNVIKSGFYFIDKSTNINFLVDDLTINSETFVISPNKKVIDVFSREVELKGAFRFPSEVSMQNVKYLSDIISDPFQLSHDAYPYFGYIKKRNFSSGSFSVKTFVPLKILSKEEDFNLSDRDIIRIFDFDEIKYLQNFIDKFPNILETHNKTITQNKNVIETSFDIDKNNPNKQISEFNKIDNASDFEVPEKDSDLLNNFNIFSKSSDNTSLNLSKETNDQVDYNDTKEILNVAELSKDEILLLISNLSHVSGNVVKPGFYPIGGSIDIIRFIESIGGFGPDPDLNKIELRGAENKNQRKNSLYPGVSVFVPSKYSYRNNILLSGAVELPRFIGFQKGMKLSSFLYSFKTLKNDVYPYFAVIERKDETNKNKVFLSFSPQSVIKMKQDISLKPGDEIRFFSNADIQELILNYAPDNEQLKPNVSLSLGNSISKSGSLEDLVKGLIIRTEGAVVNPGKFLLADIYDLETVIKISGGLNNLADTKNIEVLFPFIKGDTSIGFKSNNLDFDKLGVKQFDVIPGTLIRVSKINSILELGFVEISGRVKQPGSYQILENDSLYEVIKKSGGFLPNAYLKGLVLTREDEKKREKKSIESLRRELDKSIAMALGTMDQDFDVSDIIALRDLSNATLEFESIGRIIGDFTNIELLKRTVVRSGDKIFIPISPTSVTLVGEIMTPGSILWNKNLDVTDYVNSSAGFTQLADSKNVFIISPNGTAKRATGLWNNNHTIDPGSTIVVPRKISLASNLQKLSSVTSVIYQLTLSLAGIQSVLNN